MLKLVILDRDGVINLDSVAYIKSPAEWQPIEGSLEAIAALNQAGLKVCVATNQSGVARGYFDLATLAAIHDKMITALAAVGAQVDAIFFCPHGPDENCLCRKPKPGLYQQALNYFKVEPAEAIVIGDSLRDIEAAQAIVCPAIMVESNKAKVKAPEGVDCYSNLSEAVKHLLGSMR
jgi:D-glycero-D-manno-heptose 1,7-bisphosphate phosphatase